MAEKKPKILLLNFEDKGIGSSGLLAAEALNKNPAIEVRLLYDLDATHSELQQNRLKKISGLGVKMRSRKHLPATYLRILWYCVKFRPNVVHDFGGSAFRKNFPLWPIFAAGARLVLTEPAPEKKQLNSFLKRLVRNTAYRFGEKFIVFGPSSRESLVAFGMNESKVFQSRLGHKGFYADALRLVKPLRDPNTILFFGEFRPGKGVDLLLPIADAVYAQFPEVRFIVAGSSGYKQYQTKSAGKQLDGWLKEMRSRRYFEVHDEFIPDEKVAEYFFRAGMVVLPYREANQSGVLLSAMAMECPVVTTDVGDMKSVVRQNQNGVLCSAEPSALANALISLLRNPAHAARLAQQAKQDVEEYFDWQKIVEDYPTKVYGVSIPADKPNPNQHDSAEGTSQNVAA